MRAPELMTIGKTPIFFFFFPMERINTDRRQRNYDFTYTCVRRDHVYGLYCVINPNSCIIGAS